MLRLIRANGALSRVELASMMGLTVAAMTNIARDLLLDGAIEEAGQSVSTGGKPRTLLQIKGESAYVVGVSVDLNTINVALVDFAGNVVHTLPAGPRPKAQESLTDVISAGVRNVLELAGGGLPLLGVGLAAQGPHGRPVGGSVPPPYADQWIDPSLGEALAQELGLPVQLQNDANAVAVGEYSRSIDAHASGNFACVYLGESGLGSGIFADGQLVLGRNSYAGAIAHLSVDANGGECTCGSRGCLELYASPRALIDSARDNDSRSRERRIGVSRAGIATSTDLPILYAAARNGHPFASSQVLEASRYIASAAGTMATLLDLDLIVFAGEGFSGMEDLYLNAAREVAERFERVGGRSGFAVRMSSLGARNEAAAVGAALGVLDSLHDGAWESTSAYLSVDA